MAIYHHTTRMIGRSKGGNPVKALAYITGVKLTDQNTGEVFDFKDKSVEDVQILLPENAPIWAKEIKNLLVKIEKKGFSCFRIWLMRLKRELMDRFIERLSFRYHVN
jgi:hypothetical protein